MRRAGITFKMASEIARDGIFAINKPCGESSAQVIRVCQQHFNPSSFFKPMLDNEVARRLKESGGQFKRRRQEKRAAQVKMGHGGTLDPLATGVLILGVGTGTKQLSQFLDCTKAYETVVVFGASTDTYDRVGRILAKRPYDHITKEKLEEALKSFKGKQIQIPPLYSALKMNGKPLYEYAREGKPIPRQIEGREVEVLDIELVEFYEPGKHDHRWPIEEASASERNLAEQVWRLKKSQETAKKLTPKEKEEDDQAIAAHESFKKSFEERQDGLIRDSPKPSRQRGSKEAMMSGALGALPQSATHSNKGSNLVPSPPDKNTPPPWNDAGPPAAKIRLTVTSGYYIRSFCHDLGAKLDSAGLMAELCRTRQSDFTVGGINCLEYEELTKGEDVWGPRVADMLARWNGEPAGNWTPGGAKTNGASPGKTPVAGTQTPNGTTPTSPARTEKRRRSPSEDLPRKAAARGDNDSLRPDTPKGRRSDDEKSWNGFDD